MNKDRDATMLMPTLSDPRKKVVEPVQSESHLRTHVTYPQVYLVAVGDMVEGFTFYGPFTNAKMATLWTVENLKVGESVHVYPMSHVREIYTAG